MSWFCMTQKCVTLSSTQADYVATADGDKEALSVRRTLAFLMTREGTVSIGVCEDNKRAIDSAKTEPLWLSNIDALRYVTIASGRWLQVVISPCSIFGQKISWQIS